MERLKELIAPRSAQTGKQLFFFFMWTSLVPIILLFLAGHYTTAYLLQKEAAARHAALAEQKHSELALFVEKLQTNTAAWSTDGRIREITQKINDGQCAKVEPSAICPTAKELSDYLIKYKLPLIPAVVLIDIIGVDGVIVASSDTARIGRDESAEKNSFNEAKSLPFGHATFFPELVSENDEFDGHMMVHITAPIASSDNKRLVGVLLAHTKNNELNTVVSKNKGNTTESYIVNKEKLMVTPSRFVPDAVLKQVVNTTPVRECIERNISFTGAYKDYRDTEVFGASICDQNLFGILVVETDKAEIFIEINRLRNTATAVLVVVLILILGYALLFRADMLRSARHIFPSTLSSAITLGVVVGIIVVAVAGISFVFSRGIENFILDQKIGVITRLVTQQAVRHIDGSSPVSSFDSWETTESQKKFQDFNDEVVRSFESVRAVQLHTTSGVLVWSSLQNANIGKTDEAEKVTIALRTGEVRSKASAGTIAEMGINSIFEVYVPILGKNGDVIGVAETYLDVKDIASFTQTVQRTLWAGAFIAIVFIFLLLRYVFRMQDAKIVAQSAELSSVIDVSPIGIYTVTKKGIIEAFNPAMAHQTGIGNTEDVVGKNVFKMEYYRKSGLANLILDGLSGNTFREEIETPSPEDGTKKTYYYYGTPLKNADGEIDHLLLMSEDITERKELENKVREYTKGLESEHKAILAGLDNTAIVSIADEKGDIVYANQKFTEVSHYSHEELIGQNHRILRSDDQPQELFIDMWKTISSGKVWRGDIKNKAKDGSYYWVDGTIVPTPGDNGQPKNYVAIQILTTERKEADEKARQYLRSTEEAKAKNEALLAGLGEGMIATDNDGIIIKINNAAAKMLGLSPAEVIGKNFIDAVEAVDENNVEIPDEQRIVNSALNGVPASTLQYQYKRKNNGYFPIALIWTPAILDGKVIGAVGIFRDITKEKEIEQTRRDLLSLASHQLRTPLSGTKWLIETLKRGLHGPLNPGQTEYIDEIYKINERMTALVHDMLGVLRMEGDVSLAKKETVSTEDILATVLETFRSIAESKQMTIRMPENADYAVRTDPMLLRTILESLISNAINYSEPGRDVVINLEQKANEVVFSVKDSGIGIPKNEQRQIFERFYRASNAKTFDTGGTGLGLYVAATLAKKLGAHILFESEEGKGSTFSVHIPYLGTIDTASELVNSPTGSDI
ncbi:MAG: PAS domain S-box protein [Candidatus Yonathbacteria bacterium]|nr:PAS domain S-box protein [Candidatus Yonathbacteria bacterium]